MTQARVPNDHRNWDAIDIFLFSNGQQYTPPRKYHLRGEKLDLWEDTLHYLAKSQLGSKHSVVQLYTLQGNRIEGPLDLSNGTAYVAVDAKDAFIDTGSWEKRQARKSNGTKTDIMIADESLKIFTNSDEVDLRSIKPPEENFTTESVIDPCLNSLLKPQRSSQHEQTLKNNTPSSKQPDKRRLPSAQQAATKKSTNQPISPPVKRTSLKTKETIPKKNFKVPSRIGPSANDLNAKHKIAKTLYKIKETGNGSTPRPSKTEDIKTYSATKILTNKGLITDSSTVENIIGDQEIIILSNMNPNAAIDNKPFTVACTVQSEQIGIQKGVVVIPIDEEVQTAIEQTMNENNQGRDSRPKMVNTSSKVKIRSLQITPNNTVLSIPRGNTLRDSYVTFMNKGDLISLKLMIEVTNTDKTIYRTVRKAHSLTNVFKPEKGSQVNMEEETLIRSQMLQPNADAEILEKVVTDGSNKVLVLQCDCENEKNRNETFVRGLSSESSKKYVVIVPKWEESMGPLYMENSSGTRVSSAYNPLKIAASDISLQRINKTNSDRPARQDSTKSVIKQIPIAAEKDKTLIANINSTHQVQNNELFIEKRRVTLTDDVKQKSELNSQITLKVESKHETNGQVAAAQILPNTWDGNMVNKMDLSPAGLGHVSYEVIPNPIDTTPKISSQVSEEKSENFVADDFIGAPSNFVRYQDKSTQTELSDMVLEARIHEDGRYTFHLPSLNVLKYYDLAQ